MKVKLVGALAAAALLSACAAHPKTAASAGAGAGAGQEAAGAPTPGSEQDLVQNVGDRVFFAFNRSNLTSTSDATLTRQAAWLHKFPSVDVLVAGNCDARGTEEYNLALGQRRANAARDFLVARGVSPSRIQTISYGKDRPVALGNTSQAYAQNRNAITSVQGFNPQARGAATS